MVTSRAVTASSSRRTFMPYASPAVRTTASITSSSKLLTGSTSGRLRDFTIAVSFVPQQRGGIGRAGTQPGYERGCGPDEEERQRRTEEGWGVYRCNVVQQGRQQPRQTCRRTQADEAAERNDDGSAPDHPGQHLPRGQAEHHADAVI